VLVLVVVLVLDVLGFYGKKEIPSAAKLKPSLLRNAPEGQYDR
jgi:hypothetical protein